MKGKWKKVTLGECCLSPMYGLNATAIAFDGKHKYIRITDISDISHRFMQADITTPDYFSDEYKVLEDDILFARTGASVGKTYIYTPEDGELYFAGFLIKFHINESYCAPFIFYITQTPQYKSWASIMSMRTGQPGINAAEYSKFQFFIPVAQDDQQHIADILSTCDEVIEQTEKTIAKYRDIKAGMLQDLFTRGLDANGKLRPKPEDAPELYKDSPLGKIPKEWDTIKLQTIFAVGSGDNLPEKEIYLGPFPVFGGNGVSHYHNKYNVDEKKLIIGRVGEYCGNTFISPQFAWITDNALIVSFYTNQNINFWHIYLNYINLNQFAFAAAQPVITGKLLGKITVCEIDSKEQELILKHAQGIFSLIEREERTLSKYRSVKLGLMKKLLTPPEGALEA